MVGSSNQWNHYSPSYNHPPSRTNFNMYLTPILLCPRCSTFKAKQWTHKEIEISRHKRLKHWGCHSIKGKHSFKLHQKKENYFNISIFEGTSIKLFRSPKDAEGKESIRKPQFCLQALKMHQAWFICFSSCTWLFSLPMRMRLTDSQDSLYADSPAIQITTSNGRNRIGNGNHRQMSTAFNDKSLIEVTDSGIAMIPVHGNRRMHTHQWKWRLWNGNHFQLESKRMQTADGSDWIGIITVSNSEQLKKARLSISVTECGREIDVSLPHPIKAHLPWSWLCLEYWGLRSFLVSTIWDTPCLCRTIHLDHLAIQCPFNSSSSEQLAKPWRRFDALRYLNSTQWRTVAECIVSDLFQGTGITTDLNLSHRWKAFLPMDAAPFGIFIDSKFSQWKNALSPIDVTESGIEIAFME
mgnify:CR=1 FL=1